MASGRPGINGDNVAIYSISLFLVLKNNKLLLANKILNMFKINWKTAFFIILVFAIFLIHILCIANNLTSKIEMPEKTQASLLGVSLASSMVILGWKIYAEYFWKQKPLLDHFKTSPTHTRKTNKDGETYENLSEELDYGASGFAYRSHL